MKDVIICPRCGKNIEVYKNPLPTVDVIIYTDNKEVLLIKRKNPPFGYALPGGFVDVGETLEEAALREIKEETGLEIEIESVFGVYSSPDRDPRNHTITTVFIARFPKGQTPRAGDDAKDLNFYPLNNLPKMAFDHKIILKDFFERFNMLKKNTVSKGKSLFL
ncbi:ADP-ribose pyrophosphatase [Desulfothermus naphthae]